MPSTPHRRTASLIARLSEDEADQLLDYLERTPEKDVRRAHDDAGIGPVVRQR
ncbi:MAG: hypothetical protein J2P48_06180 [Alphaproteobacteria bacterium]|nr:hypothetical protein [Alphaproteobacteria bacterium]